MIYGTLDRNVQAIIRTVHLKHHKTLINSHSFLLQLNRN